MATVDGRQPYEGVTVSFETRHDTDGERNISETIIDAIATAKDVNPTDCDLELYDSLDLEALDTLFDRRSTDGHWRFEVSIGQYVAVVEGDGTVTVYEQ